MCDRGREARRGTRARSSGASGRRRQGSARPWEGPASGRRGPTRRSRPGSLPRSVAARDLGTPSDRRRLRKRGGRAGSSKRRNTSGIGKDMHTKSNTASTAGSGFRSRWRTDEYSVSQVLDAGGEPRSRRVADEQHRARANVRRRGAEDVVDAEVAVRLERHEGTAEERRAGGIADQRRSNALIRVRSDTVPAREQESLPPNGDPSVRLHLGPEVRDHPQLPGRLDAANDVAVHDRGGRGLTLSGGHRNDADSSLELHQRVISGNAMDGGYTHDDSEGENRLPHGRTPTSWRATGTVAQARTLARHVPQGPE